VGVVLGVAPEVEEEPVGHPVKGVPRVGLGHALIDVGADLVSGEAVVLNVIDGLEHQDGHEALEQIQKQSRNSERAHDQQAE
jgi:hypothetical protein